MKKKLFLLFAFVFSMCFTLVACGETDESIFVVTSQSAYKFYSQSLNTSEINIALAANSANLVGETKNQIYNILQLEEELKKEETAILATVDFFNLPTNSGGNKEYYFDMPSGTIYITQQTNRNYLAKLLLEDETISFEFKVTKDTLLNKYSFEYYKGQQNLACKATVTYLNNVSNLHVVIESYTQTTKLVISKEIYSLLNDNLAQRTTVIVGTGNNRRIFNVEAYSEILANKVKFAKSADDAGKIPTENLSIDNFAKSAITDIVGVVINRNLADNQCKTENFGNVNDWLA